MLCSMAPVTMAAKAPHSSNASGLIMRSQLAKICRSWRAAPAGKQHKGLAKNSPHTAAFVSSEMRLSASNAKRHRYLSNLTMMRHCSHAEARSTTHLKRPAE